MFVRVLLALAALSLLVLAPAAWSQTPPSDPDPVGAPPASDPDPSSPAGVMYELPFDNPRGDAAPLPRRSGERSGRPGSRSSGPRSSIRSENNFGSSSAVPGLEEPTGSADERAEGARGPEGEAGAEEGAEEAEDETSLAGVQPPPVFDPASERTPRAVGIILLLAVALGGIGVAALARRSASSS